MRRFLLDTNVVLDLANRDPVVWSAYRLALRRQERTVVSVVAWQELRVGALLERHGAVAERGVERILRGLPADTPLDYQAVPGAGHFAFMSPFPPAMVSPAFRPSQDPPGFDRAAYQSHLREEVLAFVRSALRP